MRSLVNVYNKIESFRLADYSWFYLKGNSINVSLGRVFSHLCFAEAVGDAGESSSI